MAREDAMKCIKMSPTTSMSKEELKVFNGMRHKHGLAEKIVTILIAYAHEKGLKEANINVLYGYATVSEAEYQKGEL